MNSGFFSGIVAGKLDAFGDLDDDGEESDEEIMVWREWRDSDRGGGAFGDVGGRLTCLLPNTASGQGRMVFLMYALWPGCAASVSTEGTGDDMISSTN